MALRTVSDPSNEQRDLAAAILYVRRREGMTQEEVAHRAGVHPTWVSRVESGRFDPRWSTVRRIAEAMGVTMTELVSIAERRRT